MEISTLMELVSALGSRLASAGAETYRVEESVIRVLAAYGLEAKVYSVPNSLIITILVQDGLPVTRLCRIESRRNDLDAVEHYNNLSRQICAQTPPPKVALQWLAQEDTARKQYNLPLRLLGHALVAGGFCVFFGGSVQDMLCAGVCGLFLGLISHFLELIHTNTFFHQIAASFLMAMAAYALAALGWTNHTDTVVIGTLMLLVPGLLFTNAIRDIIFGDTNSGLNRIVEVLLIAAAVALGTAAAWHLAEILWGISAVSSAYVYSPLVTCLASLVACTGFVLVFNIHGYGNLLCALGGGITWGVYCLTQHFGGSPLLCCFAATVIAAIYSEIMARVRKYPAISYLVISLLPLIPGAGVYYCAQQAVQGNWGSSVSQGMQALATAGAMAVGILLVSTVVRSFHIRSKQKISVR